MEMEMVGAESIGVGEDLTPPLSPISHSLHDSFLPSHCASCFSPLPIPHHQHHHHHHHLFYCSPSCSSSHSPLHIASAAHLLPHNPPSPSPSTLQTSDLRAALLLLLHIKQHPPSKSLHRICGLITNRQSLLTSTHDDDIDLCSRIKCGARAMAAAISVRDGGALDTREEFLLEEAVLCAVVTNAVEVQDSTGRSVGIAVYELSFSWINHSCSPNACYRFVSPGTRNGGDQRRLITPASSSDEPVDTCDLLTVVRSIKMIKKGEQVTIAYTDLLQPKELRRSELWSKYRFTCCCHRCVALPLTYVDQRLQEISGSSDIITEYIDDAIHDYLSSNDAESCCKKLESALLNHEIRLHPQNHLSLSAYTTLASAYSSASAMGDEDGLKMKRFSAAYSILLALLAHDLFINESSLIASVSNFWIGAGESLINLARRLSSSKWHSKWECGCGLVDVFEGDYEVLDMAQKQVLKCVSDIMRGGKVWRFLTAGNGYLEAVKGTMDLGWLESKAAAGNGRWSWSVEGEQVFGLGAHCLMYGGILSNICSGHDSHSSCYVQRLLNEL